MNDFDKLKDWIFLLKSGDAAVDNMTAQAADVTLALIKRGFDEERDPYGKPWRKKKRPDGRKVLHGETGRLRKFRAVKLLVGKHRFMVVPGAPYGAVHQVGSAWKNIVPRRMVPTEGSLPPEWAAAYREVAERTLSQHFNSIEQALKSTLK